MQRSFSKAFSLFLLFNACASSNSVQRPSELPNFSSPEKTFETLLYAISKDDVSLTCECFAPREGLDCDKFRTDLPELKRALHGSRFIKRDAELTDGKLYFWYTSVKSSEDRGRMVPMPDGTWRIWKL